MRVHHRETETPASHTLPSRGARAGSSMLEVMVALGILAVGLLGMTAGQIMAMKQSTNSRSQTIAMHLAEQSMEALQGSSAADVTAMTALPGYPNDPANPIDPDMDGATHMQFFRRQLIQPDTPEAGVITITVEVDWTDPRGTVRTVRIESLKRDS